jgi:hypothetical protein
MPVNAHLACSGTLDVIVSKEPLGQALRTELARKNLAPHAECGSRPDAACTSGSSNGSPGCESGLHPRDTVVLDGWAAKPYPQAPRPLSPGGDRVLMQAHLKRSESVEPGAKQGESLRRVCRDD